MSSKTLACIYPVRESDVRDIVARIDLIETDRLRPRDVEVLVVDDGCSESSARQIREKCRQRGYVYLQSSGPSQPPCMSRARNFGAMHASARFVVFHDIDLILFDGYFNSLLMQIEVMNLDAYSNDFIALPVIYLTREATEKLVGSVSTAQLAPLARRVLLGDQSACDHIAAVSSVNVIGRVYYLSIGGYSEEFEYWGYEDSEFAHRIVKLANRFPKPFFYHFHLDHQYEHQVLYIGWRSAFRLWGDESRCSGLILFHAWHEHKGVTYKAAARIRANRRRFIWATRRVRVDPLYLPPLQNLSGVKTVLVKGGPRPPLERMKPLFGNVVMELTAEPAGVECDRMASQGVSRWIIDGPPPRQNGSAALRRGEIYCLKQSLLGDVWYFMGAAGYVGISRVRDSEAIAQWLRGACDRVFKGDGSAVLLDLVDDFGRPADGLRAFAQQAFPARSLDILECHDLSEASGVVSAIRGSSVICSNRVDLVLIGLLIGKPVYTSLSIDNDSIHLAESSAPAQLALGHGEIARIVAGFYSIYGDDRCLLANFAGQGILFEPLAAPRIGYEAEVFDRYRLFLYLTCRDIRGVKVWLYSLRRLLSEKVAYIVRLGKKSRDRGSARS